MRRFEPCRAYAKDAPAGPRPWFWKLSAKLVQPRVRSQDRPTLARVQILGRLEAEAAHVSQSADPPVAPCAGVSLAGVFENRQLVLFSDRENYVHVHWVSTQMHWHDAARPRGELRLDLMGIDLGGFPIGVHKHRQSVLHQNDVERGDKSIRGKNDLIAGADSQRVERGVKGCRPARRRHTIFRPQGSCPSLFEACRIVAVGCPAPVLAMQHFHPALFVVLLDDRPGRKRIGPDRFAAEQSEFLLFRTRCSDAGKPCACGQS